MPSEMVDQRRREVRFRLQVPATLGVGKKTQALMTEDVSFRGLFVRTDTPPGLRQLIRIEVELPSGKKFKANAMAVYVITAGDPAGRVPGAGLQFYALGRDEGEVWNAFVTEVSKQYPQVVDEPVQVAPPPEPEPIRRKHPRVPARFQLRPRNVDALYEMYTRDISKGGMFVMTAQPLTVGDPLEVQIIHPLSEAAFELSCEVRRLEPKAPQPGVGVELVDMTDARRAAFYEFVCTGIPEVDDVLLVADDDEQLA